MTGPYLLSWFHLEKTVIQMLWDMPDNQSFIHLLWVMLITIVQTPLF